jgi:hypothetical protein
LQVRLFLRVWLYGQPWMQGIYFAVRNRISMYLHASTPDLFFCMSYLSYSRCCISLLTLVASAGLLLAGCGGQDTNNTASAATKNNTAKAADYLSISGDSVLLPPFTIALQLSKNAEEKLLREKETLVITASFSGQLKDTASAQYREWGSLPLASTVVETDTGRTVKFEHVKFARAKLDSLADRDVSVLVHVYSGRRSTADNLLDFSILFDKMSAVKMRTIPLTGRLLNEVVSLAK